MFKLAVCVVDMLQNDGDGDKAFRTSTIVAMFVITLQNGGTVMSGSMIATMCVCDWPSWQCQSQAPPGPLWLNPSSHCLSPRDKQSDRPP